ncbi:MAG TPA: CbiX/SirB N-terminal domain-containing protein [Candidatus Bathyarchaeia archaeon]|nr:CbiX/SirB N-terminal domain-containing protein [Candidatus Bathyarchaeia archaeon]
MNNSPKKGIKIVLAMHGSPPKDFPMDEMAFFYGIHLRLEHNPQSVDNETKKRALAIEEKMKNWPRTYENDPYFTSSIEIGKNVEEITGYETLVGFNEFCNPAVKDVLLKALETNPNTIFVTTPMITPGGEHSEIDIPETITAISKDYPNTKIIYAWPFDLVDVANFLSNQIRKHS